MSQFQHVVLRVGKNDIIKLEMAGLRAHVVSVHKGGVVRAVTYQFPHHDEILDAYNFFKKNEGQIKKLIIQK